MSNLIHINTKLGKFHLDIKVNLVNGINCFFGPSGAGKTSIINCIAGLNQPEEAKIIINKNTLVDTESKVFKPVHKRGIGYVFQDSRLFPHLNIKHNLLYGYRLNSTLNKVFLYDEIVELLDLKFLLDRFPNYLSGGEKQRVAIGRALLSQPKLILMDEPLSSLDNNKKTELVTYIARVNSALKIPAIYVSHSISETFILGNRIHFIEDGKVVFSGNRTKSLLFYNKNDNSILKDSFLKGVVKKINKSEGLIEIKLNNEKLIIFSKILKLNQQVIVKVRSSDIIVSKLLPKQISSLNYLKANVLDILFQDSLVCLILVVGNNNLKAHLTIKSFKRLKIKKGTKCYAIIKAININDIIDISLI